MKNIPIRKRQRRITISDLETLAQLCECERLNYREACGVLGLNYDSWRNWKERAENEARYSDIVARVKGAWLKGRLDNIHDAEIGRRGHRCDWRASKALLEISSPQRYGSQPQVDPVAQPVVAISVVSSWWPKDAPANALPEPARPQPAVMDARELKALPPPPTSSWTIPRGRSSTEQRDKNLSQTNGQQAPEGK